jgi:hypothetical protein
MYTPTHTPRDPKAENEVGLMRTMYGSLSKNLSKYHPVLPVTDEHLKAVPQ